MMQHHITLDIFEILEAGLNIDVPWIPREHYPTDNGLWMA